MSMEIAPGSAHHVRISVVTPSFNQRKYVEATLRSVIAQGYPDLEYIVVDGGSTDGSVDVIREHAAHLTSWTSEPDRGHAHALNKGFAKSTGDVMCWLNSSDLHYPWTLQTVADVFTALPDVDWITGIPSVFSERGGPKGIWPVYSNFYDCLAGDSHSIQQESVFWRRRLWERAGGYLDEDLRCAGDLDLWLRFFRLAPLYHVETVLAGWRKHEDPLGEYAGGRYERERQMLLSRCAASCDARTRRRGRIVRALTWGPGRIVGQALHRGGIWPWYRHPRIVFDWEEETWVHR